MAIIPPRKAMKNKQHKTSVQLLFSMGPLAKVSSTGSPMYSCLSEGAFETLLEGINWV